MWEPNLAAKAEPADPDFDLETCGCAASPYSKVRHTFALKHEGQAYTPELVSYKLQAHKPCITERNLFSETAPRLALNFNHLIQEELGRQITHGTSRFGANAQGRTFRCGSLVLAGYDPDSMVFATRVLHDMSSSFSDGGPLACKLMSVSFGIFTASSLLLKSAVEAASARASQDMLEEIQKLHANRNNATEAYRKLRTSHQSLLDRLQPLLRKTPGHDNENLIPHAHAHSQQEVAISAEDHLLHIQDHWKEHRESAPLSNLEISSIKTRLAR